MTTGPWSGEGANMGVDLLGGRAWKRQKSYPGKWEKEVAANKLGASGLE